MVQSWWRTLASRLVGRTRWELMAVGAPFVLGFLLMVILQVGLEGWLRPVQAARRILPPEMGGFHSLAGRSFPREDASGALVVGAYEGEFLGTTRQLTIWSRGERWTLPGADGATDLPLELATGTPLPTGPAGFSISTVQSSFVNDGLNPATVSGEIQITNNTTSVFYNTRLVFTSFRVSATGAPAGNTPGNTGLAYFNDGMVPFGGQLHVSRLYGDIAPGVSTRNVWNFAVTSSPQTFRFGFVVLADLGVSVESVSPAAVQVTAGTGTSVQIRGRGFNSPQVALVDSAGNLVRTAALVSSTAQEIVATVPAGTPPGNYGVRVINQGGQAGGAGSSTLPGRLTVTNPPDAAHTISGTISAFSDTGPYLINGPAVLANPTTVLAGTVLYFASGASLSLGAGGTLTANGGVPGVSMTGVLIPNQIVLTAQRAPGAALPTPGAWGGVSATTVSTQVMTLRNVVLEYGGASGGAALNLSASGRTLRITDSVVRFSAGSGLTALDADDRIQNFSRNRIERNGTSPSHSAMLISGNASLGLYELPDNSIPTGTSVADPSYFYSSANTFQANQIDAVEIGTVSDALSNDFSIDGVLVGQGSTPLIIRGGPSNPSIIGSTGPGSLASPGFNLTLGTLGPLGAEVTIGPTTRIQLAAGMDLQVGDFPSNRRGGLSANGYAGSYLGPQAGTSNRSVVFESVSGEQNFGSIFFTRRALSSSILNNVQIERGGNGQRGAVPLIVEAVTIQVTNSRIDGGLLETLGAVVDKRGSGFVNTTSVPIIDTVAGGILGNGNLGTQAILGNPVCLVYDPLGRGLFFSDSPSTSYVRFLNTGRETVVVAGISIPAGTVRIIAGGGDDFGENVQGSDADLGQVTGMAISPDGGLLYFIDSIVPVIRAINISPATRSIAGTPTEVGRVRTFAETGLGASLYSLATNPFSGDLFVCDSTPSINKVLRFSANQPSVGTPPTVFAGNGEATRDTAPFVPGPATSIPLLQPRALTFRGGSLIVSDTGHARVLQISSNGSVTLISQLAVNPSSTLPGSPYTINPYTSGLAVFNDRVLLANGSAQDLIRIDTNGTPPATTTLAGAANTFCDYTLDQCGDGGPGTAARFNLLTRNTFIALVGLAVDAHGVYIADQGTSNRGRIRYLNLSPSTVEVAGVVIAPGTIATVAGAGLIPPFFDGSLATSGALNQAQGVAMDAEGNLWIADTNSNKLRFVNLSRTPKTIFPGTTSSKVIQPGTIVTVNDGASQPDPTPVINSFFNTPTGIQATAEGLFIADTLRGPATIGTNARRTGLIRYINTTNQTIQMPNTGETTAVLPGQAVTISGGSTNGSPTFYGDGSAGDGVKYLVPTDIAIHPTNRNIYVADAGNKRVRLINRNTGITTSLVLPSPSTSDEITGLAFDSAGRLLVVNAGMRRILREKTPGSGTFNNGFDIILSGGLLNRPRDLVEGLDGALYVVNAGDSVTPQHQILRVTVNSATNQGTATVYLGGSIPGYRGDGGPITGARINIQPEPVNIATIGTQAFVQTSVGIIRGLNGELIFADPKNNAIRRIR
jgi:sugar lactone lactonase YvrE